MSEEPNTPITALWESALAMHEIFLTFMEAGFSESQALFMMVEMIKNTKPQ